MTTTERKIQELTERLARVEAERDRLRADRDALRAAVGQFREYLGRERRQVELAESQFKYFDAPESREVTIEQYQSGSDRTGG